MFPTVRPRALILLACLAVAACAGCGGGDDDPLLAEVGDAEIRASEYEARLALLERTDLPKDEQGRPLDMSLPASKSDFLTTLIRKELMVAKAQQLGYANEPQAVNARKSMMAYEAGLAMGFDIVNRPAERITEQEVQTFYARLGETRLLNYIVANFEHEAAAAAAMARDGADWYDVAEEYHKGDYPQSGLLEISVPWGRFDLDFEQGVFGLEEGEISDPIETDYGWWVVRIIEIDPGTKPELEAAREDIETAVKRRKMSSLQKQFRRSVYEIYDVQVHDEGLAVVWNALPEDELYVDPATDEPIPQEELADLDIRPADLDVPFYSYRKDGELHAYTVGDYKIRYDRMNTFQRPKREQMAGGLRSHILQELERSLMDAEARKRGYYEDIDVIAKVDEKLEEMLVTRLYSEVVTIDEKVTREQFDAYWEENHERFATPEKRSGRLVIATDENAAAAAREAIVGGRLWRDVVQEYGTDNTNKRNSGKLDEVSARAVGAVPEALFALESGELSGPFPVGDGRYAIVRCDRILPGKPADRDGSRDAVREAIKAQRKEDKFLALLDEWAVEIGVTRYDENLDSVRSWQELVRERHDAAAI